MMPINKALFVTAVLLLLASLFPVEKETVLHWSRLNNRFAAFTYRQITFLWTPIQPIGPENLYRSASETLGTDLDWGTCTLELVAIVSFFYIYLCWLQQSWGEKLKARWRKKPRK
jgi:hypothetical protein